jgi:hypothetical protein
LKLRAVEVATHPRDGVDLDSLGSAVLANPSGESLLVHDQIFRTRWGA